MSFLYLHINIYIYIYLGSFVIPYVDTHPSHTLCDLYLLFVILCCHHIYIYIFAIRLQVFHCIAPALARVYETSP